MYILIFPSKIWAKKHTLYTAKYWHRGSLIWSLGGQPDPEKAPGLFFLGEAHCPLSH